MQRLPWLPRFIVGELNLAELIQKMRECDTPFQPRQRSAETEVDAVTKGDVGIGAARNIEPIRIRDMRHVSIRRSDHYEDEAVCRSRAVQFDVACGLPKHHLTR